MLLSIENPKSKIQNARTGVTLMEVLLAIFVMGIGMLALLVLFPIGMLTMAQAIKDDRVASATANAQAVAEMAQIDPATGQLYTLRTDIGIEVAIRDELAGQAITSPTPSLNPYFVDTTPGGIAPGSALPLFNRFGPSPPVFVDPQGALLWPDLASQDPRIPPIRVGRCVGVGAGAGSPRVQVNYWNPYFAAGTTAYSYGIRRVRPTFALTAADVRRTFMQEDEITFDPNGAPRTNGVLVERWRKYSWAYMWRKPRWSEPKVADLAIVMFAGRQVEGTPGVGTPPEPYYLGHNPANALDGRAFIAGSTQVRLKVVLGTTLPAKRGDWLLDATVIPPDGTTAPPILTHFNGYFYKIIEVGEVQAVSGTEGYQTLEIGRPALADGYVGVMITGVADVVEKNDGRMPPG